MKKIIAFLAILMMFPMYSFADRYGEQQVILHHTKGHGGHLENYPIADIPTRCITTATRWKSSSLPTAPHYTIMWKSSATR